MISSIISVVNSPSNHITTKSMAFATEVFVINSAMTSSFTLFSGWSSEWSSSIEILSSQAEIKNLQNSELELKKVQAQIERRKESKDG